MKRLSSILLVASAMAVAIPPSLSFGENAFGYSGTTCGKWTQERRLNSTKSEALVAWVFGFISGTNKISILSLRRPDFLAHTDPPAVLAWMDKYCGENPLANLEDASTELLLRLTDFWRD